MFHVNMTSIQVTKTNVMCMVHSPLISRNLCAVKCFFIRECSVLITFLSWAQAGLTKTNVVYNFIERANQNLYKLSSFRFPSLLSLQPARRLM